MQYDRNDGLQTVIKTFCCLYFCLLKIVGKEVTLGTLATEIEFGKAVSMKSFTLLHEIAAVNQRGLNKLKEDE